MEDKESVNTSVLSPKLGGGPHGLGDPDDRSLRVVEKDILIPRYVKKKAKEKCTAEVAVFSECGKREGLLLPFKCRQENRLMMECVVNWFKNKEFYQQCKEEYLQHRSEYRRTGIAKKQSRRDSAI